jgi:twinkle protein
MVYEDGGQHCFSCGYHKNADNNKELEQPIIEKESTTFDPLTNAFHDFKARAISVAAVKRYGVDVRLNGNVEAKYPVFANGVHVGNKIRYKDTSKGRFSYEGTGRGLDLFGQQAFPSGQQTVTIVEGQDDAMAAYEMFGFKYPFVSVHGADSALEDCKRNFEYLDSFKEIVICFDRDSEKVNPKTGEKRFPGQEAAIKVAGLFKPGKVKILTLREYKDANDYLKAGRSAQFTKEWWQAPTYKPDGIKLGSQMWDEIINRPNHFTVPYPFEGLNKFTYGMRLSEVVVLTAETGIGKTSVLKEIEYNLLTNPEIVEKGYGVGFLHLEEPNHDTALGLMSIHNSKPYHLPDTERTNDELRSAYDAVINSDRVVIWDHFGSNSVDAVLDKIRHMVALGCKYIVVDHLSIIVSDQSGDERKQLDEISTKIKTLCMELNIAVLCVIHQNRQGQIRGTAGVEQLANMVVKLERDVTAVNPWRRNVTKMTIQKNRFCGRAGPACYVWYNEHTGRLQELDDEEIADYEAGNDRRDDQIAF